MNNRLNFTLLLLALLLPASAAAAVPPTGADHNTTYDFYVDGIYYDIIGNEATVTCKHLSVNQTGIFSIRSDYRGNVVIPSTVTHNGTTYPVTAIGFSAFYDCDSLTSVTIPNSVTSIESDAFRGCRSLTSVNIPNSVTSIGNYAFDSCSGLTSIVIPNSVTSIGDCAFYDCSGLKSVELPNSLVDIGRSAFCGCPNISEVMLLNPNPPLCATDMTTFDNDVFNVAKLYVPKESVALYKASDKWGQFTHIIGVNTSN